MISVIKSGEYDIIFIHEKNVIPEDLFLIHEGLNMLKD